MKTRKALSLILVLCMMLTILSLGMISAAAEEEDEDLAEVGRIDIHHEIMTPQTEQNGENLQDLQAKLERTEEPDRVAAPGGGMGSWKFSDVATDNLTADEKAVFDKALEKLAGTSYEPKDVIATQLVSGTNYAFLCIGTPVTLNPESYWTVVTVYQDIQGNVTLLGMKDIDIAAVKTLENIPEGGAGAWTSTAKAKSALIPNSVKFVLDSNEGLSLSSIAILGTQRVAGTNYRILAYGTLVSNEPRTDLYVVDVYENLDGDAEITSIAAFDLHSYISGGNAPIENPTEVPTEKPTADPNSKSPNTGHSSEAMPVVLLILFAMMAAGVSVYGIAKKRG